MKTWQWWAFMAVMIAILLCSLVFVWLVTLKMGLGPFGRMALEFIFHLTLVVIGVHPLLEKYSLPYIRAALTEELLSFARDGLNPHTRRHGSRIKPFRVRQPAQ
jgi:hypothetical protein